MLHSSLIHSTILCLFFNIMSGLLRVHALQVYKQIFKLIPIAFSNDFAIQVINCLLIRIFVTYDGYEQCRQK